MIRRSLAALTLGSIALFAAAAGARAETAKAPEMDAAHQVLVLLRLPPEHFRPNGDYADSYGDGAGLAARRRIANRIASEHGLKLVTNWPIPILGVDCFVMSIPESQSPDQVAELLTHDPNVAGAEAMHVYVAQGPAGSSPTAPVTLEPAAAMEVSHNDPLYRAQPAAKEWRLAELHAVSTGRGVRVAVIDSMVDTTQPDLIGQIQTSQNFVYGKASGPESHGTGVAGVIVGIADNHLGIAGVAPHARLMALRACWQQPGASTVCDTLSLAKALYFAIDHNAQVINLSLAGPPDPILGRLIDVAEQRGMTVVGAVDPSMPGGGFPASHAGVVAVSDDPATPVAGAFVAPGRQTPTTLPGGKFGLVTGSSYAAAHVSGLVALLREHNGRPVSPLSLITYKPGGGAIDTCATLLHAAGPGCAKPQTVSTVARQ